LTLVDVVTNNASLIVHYLGQSNISIPNAVSVTSASGFVHLGFSFGWNGGDVNDGQFCFSAFQGT